MPNWVMNRLTLDGKNITDVLMKVSTFDEYGDEVEFDFNKVIPMPEELKIEKSNRQYDGVRLFLAILNPYHSEFKERKKKLSSKRFSKLISKLWSDDISWQIDKLAISSDEIIELKEKILKNRL